MGYESRIFIVNRKDCSFLETKANHVVIEHKCIYGEKIAEFNLCKVSGDAGFIELFKTPIDYKLFVDNEDEDTDTDKYGEKMKYATLPEVIEWVENQIAKEEETGMVYRRWEPFLGLLEGFDELEWDEIQVVHYGY